jgi:hypothetical protein
VQKSITSRFLPELGGRRPGGIVAHVWKSNSKWLGARRG